MATVIKKISKQAKPVVAKAKRPVPVKVAKVVSDNLLSQTLPEPIQVRQLIVEPTTAPVAVSDTGSDNLLSRPAPEVDTYTEPDTTIQTTKAPTMRKVVVGLAGGSVAGVLAYNGLKTVFLDKGYSADQANQYAMISAGVIGLVVFGILYKVA